MSIADFVLTFVAIVIGLGVADVLVSFHRLLRAGRRVKWHWATPLFASMMLLVTIVLWWWSFHWFSAVTSVTIAGFLPTLLVLVVSFLMMAAALPDEIPEGGIDLRQFYFSSRVHLWSLVSIIMAASIIAHFMDNWSLGLIQILSIVWPLMISFALAVAAALTPRLLVHALAIGWISAVTLYNNLFMSIGQ